MRLASTTAAGYLNQLAAGGLLQKQKQGVANYYLNQPLLDLLAQIEQPALPVLAKNRPPRTSASLAAATAYNASRAKVVVAEAVRAVAQIGNLAQQWNPVS